MRQATDEEIKAAFDRHLKASNLPAQIKNGDYRSGWVRQAWASFYSGWRRCEDRKMDNVDVTGPRLRGSGGQQGSTAQPPSSGD